MPNYIWAEQVIGTSITRNLGNMEDRLRNAKDNLSAARMTMDQCLPLWEDQDPSTNNRAQELY